MCLLKVINHWLTREKFNEQMKNYVNEIKTLEMQTIVSYNL